MSYAIIRRTNSLSKRPTPSAERFRFQYRLVSLRTFGAMVDRALHLVARRRVVRADLEPEPYLRANEVDGIVSAGLLDEPTGFEARIGNLKIHFAQWRIA